MYTIVMKLFLVSSYAYAISSFITYMGSFSAWLLIYEVLCMLYCLQHATPSSLLYLSTPMPYVFIISSFIFFYAMHSSCNSSIVNSFLNHLFSFIMQLLFITITTFINCFTQYITSFKFSILWCFHVYALLLFLLYIKNIFYVLLTCIKS